MPKTSQSRAYGRFIAKLREARQSAGLTQVTLAARLSRPQSYVAKYEGGERRLDVVEFLEIVQAIGCDAAAILESVKKEMGDSAARG